MNIQIEPYRVKRITMEEVDILQQLCERCSDYYDIVEGRTPKPGDAHEIVTELPPNKDDEDKFVLGIYNQSSALVGVMDIIRNFPVEGEWMIGLLMIDPCERGKGLGRKIHEALVKSASELGIKTLRIGVASDNHKAYSFWTAMQYTKIKEVPMKLGNKDSMVYLMQYYIQKDVTI